MWPQEREQPLVPDKLEVKENSGYLWDAGEGVLYHKGCHLIPVFGPGKKKIAIDAIYFGTTKFGAKPEEVA